MIEQAFRAAARAASMSAATLLAGEADEIRRDLDDILNQPAFRRLRRDAAPTAEIEPDPEVPDWIKKPLRWLWDWFTRRAERLSAMGWLWQMVAYTALAVICALIILLVVRAVNSYLAYHADSVTRTLRPEEGEAALPPGDIPADEYERRAEELAAQAKYREAVGQLILGGMSRAERARLIRFRRGLTHRDYLRALRQRPESQQAFRTMVSIYEPICFGRRPDYDHHYHEARSAYRAGFERSATLQPISA